MARPANSENIKRDEAGPDFQQSIGLIRGKIRANESDISSSAQDNSTLYKRIEKMGVHRGAAKDFAKIDKMGSEKRTDYLRSLLGLLGFAGYNDFNDLVDRAQRPGKARPPKADKGEKTPGATPDAIGNEDPAVLEQRERENDPMFDDEAEGNVHPFPGQKTN